MAWLVAGAVAVVVALAAYAGYLHWRLYRLRQSVDVPRQAVDGPRVGVVEPGATAAQRLALRRSIHLLADAILAEKLTHTEGCLRICAIAANLEEQGQFRVEYGVLFRVAEATAHIPILDAWQALSAEDKGRFDRERRAVEAKYTEAVIEAARRIKDHYPL